MIDENGVNVRPTWRDWVDAREPRRPDDRVEIILDGVKNIRAWRAEQAPLNIRCQALTELHAVLQHGDTLDVGHVPGTWPRRPVVPEEFGLAVKFKGADLTEHVAMVLGVRIWDSPHGVCTLPVQMEVRQSPARFAAVCVTALLGWHVFGHHDFRAVGSPLGMRFHKCVPA